ncbi:hypothetical protein [Brevundimonas sp. GCM10030266]|uniref:hypothetical protein n=1 Tax=Brevundimonas sp. GCM10030266 TaxID=3273386 RepID=UPI00360A2816
MSASALIALLAALEVVQATTPAPEAEPPIDGVAEHRAWLAEQGLLANRPRLVPGQTAAFALATERHCGVTPGSLLTVDPATGALSFAGGDGVQGLDRFLCVFAVLNVAVAEDQAPDRDAAE